MKDKIVRYTGPDDWFDPKRILTFCVGVEQAKPRLVRIEAPENISPQEFETLSRLIHLMISEHDYKDEINSWMDTSLELFLEQRAFYLPSRGEAG